MKNIESSPNECLVGVENTASMIKRSPAFVRRLAPFLSLQMWLIYGGAKKVSRDQLCAAAAAGDKTYDFVACRYNFPCERGIKSGSDCCSRNNVQSVQRCGWAVNQPRVCSVAVLQPDRVFESIFLDSDLDPSELEHTKDFINAAPRIYVH